MGRNGGGRKGLRGSGREEERELRWKVKRREGSGRKRKELRHFKNHQEQKRTREEMASGCEEEGKGRGGKKTQERNGGAQRGKGRRR